MKEPLSPEERLQANNLRQDPRVKKALEESDQTTNGLLLIKERDKAVVGFYFLMLLCIGLTYALLRFQVLHLPEKYAALSERLMVSLLLATLILMVSRLLKTVLAARLENATTEYTVKRVTNLITFLLILLVALSLLFVNRYATIVSLGLISLILGLALQNPLISFFAWIYILLTKSYRVGLMNLSVVVH